MSTRFRRLTDLFVAGKAVELPDHSYIWIQALNSYQRDECVSDAQITRSRLVMALREQGSERLKIEGKFYEEGREKMVTDLARHRAQVKMGDFIDTLRADPEWKERLDILMRTDQQDTAAALTLEEIELLQKINAQVMDELNRQEVEEIAFLERSFENQDDSEIIDAWTEDFLETRGGEVATGEYRMTEMWYAGRWCNAVKNSDGELDHAGCDSHQERIFETRQMVKEASNELILLLTDTLNELNLAGRDPKDSASAPSSSSSSPTPSAAEESTPATSTEALATVPGT